MSHAAFSFSAAPVETFDRELDYKLFNKRTEFAARYLGISEDALKAYRKVKHCGRPREPIGPEFISINGRLCLYSIESLQRWADSQKRGGQRASK